jgi:hypothetical protein
MFCKYGTLLHTPLMLACTINGMPFVYSGQEAELGRLLAFFEKEEIV